ncbi:MAG: hypothetical protein U1F43_31825 [Myxococcota bacterium]
MPTRDQLRRLRLPLPRSLALYLIVFVGAGPSPTSTRRPRLPPVRVQGSASRVLAPTSVPKALLHARAAGARRITIADNLAGAGSAVLMIVLRTPASA